DVATKLQMIEEEIEVEVFAPDFEPVLLADEGEAHAELEEELADMFDEASFEIALFGLSGEREEVECVRILQQLASKIGLWRRQGALEVRASLALAAVEIALDPVDQDVAAPAMFNGRLCVPEPLFEILDLLDQDDVVPPGKSGQRKGEVPLG